MQADVERVAELVPEQLPGEPLRGPARGARLLVLIAARALLVLILSGIGLALAPLFGLSALIWGYPPNVPRPSQIARYLRYTWTVKPGPPGLPLSHRVWLTLQILRKAAVTPLWGLAWQLDELLYGRALSAVTLRAPLILISAARSGSTQMGRYLEGDPQLVAPSVLQAMFPYLWLWRLAPSTLGRVLDRERVVQLAHAQMPAEFLERHEGDPFRTDTYEASFYLFHLNHLSVFLGPRVFRDEFNVGVAAPWNRHLWEVIFVELFDRVARKTLLHQGAPGQRLFVKGHFLPAADALERRYPDARFLTVLRDPSKRLQSAVNFLRSNPIDPTLNEPPWAWLGPAVADTETDYNASEQAWYRREGGAARCVVRFRDYVRDLEGTMKEVYRVCMDAEVLPAHVPREHEPRRRSSYALNRDLPQFGVDPERFRQRNAAFIAWCEGE